MNIVFQPDTRKDRSHHFADFLENMKLIRCVLQRLIFTYFLVVSFCRDRRNFSDGTPQKVSEYGHIFVTLMLSSTYFCQTYDTQTCVTCSSAFCERLRETVWCRKEIAELLPRDVCIII